MGRLLYVERKTLNTQSVISIYPPLVHVFISLAMHSGCDKSRMFFWVKPPLSLFRFSIFPQQFPRAHCVHSLTAIVCVLLISKWVVFNGHISTCRRLVKLRKLTSGLFCSVGNQKLGESGPNKAKAFPKKRYTSWKTKASEAIIRET